MQRIVMPAIVALIFAIAALIVINNTLVMLGRMAP